MKAYIVAVAALLMGSSIALADLQTDKESNCYLEVDKVEYIIGTCEITQAFKDDGEKIEWISLDNGKWSVMLAHFDDKKNTAQVVWGPWNGKGNVPQEKYENLGDAKADKSDLGYGCWVNERVRVCGTLSTTAMNASFLQDGRCLFESKGKKLIDGDCEYFLFKGTDSQDGYDLSTRKLIVMNIDQTVMAMVMANSNPDLGDSATMFRVNLKDNLKFDELGAPTARGPCWVADEAKLCVWKSE